MKNRVTIEIKIASDSPEMKEIIANAMNSLSERDLSALRNLGVNIPQKVSEIAVSEFAKLLPYYRRVWLNLYGEIAYYNGCMPCKNPKGDFKVVTYKIFDYSPKRNMAGQIECFALSCVEQN